mmetsp:Transcript_42551/g.71011  ORF Transcript_42551/g.71011 Transcript_42551/m.71011 type:complete len:229 (-) Transcript_42551:4037-4723(-)
MYRMREVTTSMTWPFSPPSRCSSSAMNSATACTFLRCFHLREIMSQFSGVEQIRLPFSTSLRSVALSPVSSTTLRPRAPNLADHPRWRMAATDSKGPMYTARMPARFSLCLFSRRMMANSAQMVLPEPVGAPTSTLSSLLYSEVKTCVWMGLKWVMPLNKASYSGVRSAVTGSGCKSRSSVGGGYFSGRMRWRKDTGRRVSAPSQRSDTMRMKYCGGSGSSTGTVNDR